MLSCHVMSYYVMLSVTTLPLFDTSVTVANMNNPRSDYNKCEYAQNVSIKYSNFQRQLFVINQTPHLLRPTGRGAVWASLDKTSQLAI